MAKRSKSKRSSASERAKRGWKTRRRNQRERSERAKRGWKTRKRNESKKRASQGGKRKLEPQSGRKTPTSKRGTFSDTKRINTVAEWEALDFSETEAIEIAGNADY